MAVVASLRVEIEQALNRLEQLDAPPLERPATTSSTPFDPKAGQARFLRDLTVKDENEKLMKKLEAELKASRDAYAKGVVTMQSLELEKADLVSKIAIQQAGIDKASEGIIAVTQARADAIAAELSKMSESVASKEEAVDDLEGDIAHLVNESKKNEAVRSQISTDLKDAQAVVDQITGQTKVLADLRARIKKAEEESRAYGDRIAQAKSRGQQRERETKDVESRIEAAGKSSAQKDEIATLEKDVEELRQRAVALDAEIKEEEIELLKVLEKHSESDDATPNQLEACTDARIVAACNSLEAVPDVPLAAIRLDRGTSLMTIKEDKFSALTAFILKQHRAIVDVTKRAQVVTSKRNADLAKEKEEQLRLEAMIDGHYERDAQRRATSPGDASFSSYGGIGGQTSVKALEDRIHRRLTASIKLKARSARLAEQILAAQVDQLERLEEMIKENEA